MKAHLLTPTRASATPTRCAPRRSAGAEQPSCHGGSAARPQPSPRPCRLHGAAARGRCAHVAGAVAGAGAFCHRRRRLRRPGAPAQLHGAGAQAARDAGGWPPARREPTRRRRARHVRRRPPRPGDGVQGADGKEEELLLEARRPAGTHVPARQQPSPAPAPAKVPLGHPADLRLVGDPAGKRPARGRRGRCRARCPARRPRRRPPPAARRPPPVPPRDRRPPALFSLPQPAGRQRSSTLPTSLSAAAGDPVLAKKICSSRRAIMAQFSAQPLNPNLDPYALRCASCSREGLVRRQTEMAVSSGVAPPHRLRLTLTLSLSLSLSLTSAFVAYVTRRRTRKPSALRSTLQAGLAPPT